MLPRLPPSLEIAIRGAAGVICVQWRQAMMTGRVKRWSGRSRRAEAGWGGRDPRCPRERYRGIRPRYRQNFAEKILSNLFAYQKTALTPFRRLVAIEPGDPLRADPEAR